MKAWHLLHSQSTVPPSFHIIPTLYLVLKWVDNNEITVVITVDIYIYYETNFDTNYSFASTVECILIAPCLKNMYVSLITHFYVNQNKGQVYILCFTFAFHPDPARRLSSKIYNMSQCRMCSS